MSDSVKLLLVDDLPENLLALQALLEAARAEPQRLLDRLRQTQAELQRALKMRDEFLSMVTHELRTPLGVMALEVMMRRSRSDKGDIVQKFERLDASSKAQGGRIAVQSAPGEGTCFEVLLPLQPSS